jgi:glutamine amidotransferase
VIAIVDYGVGNLGSALKAFRRAGAQAELVSDPADLSRAEALVLPGDGAFGATMDEIRGRGLAAALVSAARAGVPLFGICVGMQVLFEEGEEHGRHAGLGLLPGRVRRFAGPAFDGERGLAVPHMGWNALRREREHPLLHGLRDGEHVYFVHSYWCDAAPADVIASCEYGFAFPAMVARGNVMAAQFHPEKSQAVGLRMVDAFVRLVAARRAGVAEAAPC